MNEQAPVVEAPAVTEPAPVVETPAPIETAPVVEEQGLPEIDFSDLIDSAPLQAPPQQADMSQIVDQLAQQIAERLGLTQKPEQEAQPEQLTVEQIEQQRVLQRIQEQQQAQAYIQKNIQESNIVEQKYVQKLTDALSKQGIDYGSDQALQAASNLLYTQLKINAAQQLGRSQPVFTQDETKQLVETHFRQFADVFLKGRIQKPRQAPVNSLSPSNTSIPQTTATPRSPDEFSQFMEKKKAGKETLSDAVNMLRKLK